MTIEIHKSDVGTQFIIQLMDRQPNGTKIPLDISTATTLKIIWTKPDGITQITRTNSTTPAVSLLNTGSDGKMQFTNKTGADQSVVLDQVDDFWKIEGEVTLIDGKIFHTVQKGKFKVIDKT